MKARITRKKINLLKLFFMNYIKTSVRRSLQYFIWLNSKTVKKYSVVKSVKLILVLNILHTCIVDSTHFLLLQKVKGMLSLLH